MAIKIVCNFGATISAAEVHHSPVRKRTRLLTNSVRVVNAFRNHMCQNDHIHQILEGVEGGIKRNLYAQRYPPDLVDALVSCARG